MENRDILNEDILLEEKALTRRMFKKGVLVGTLVTFMLFAVAFGMYGAHNFLEQRLFPPAIIVEEPPEEHSEGKLQEIHDIITTYFLFADDIDEDALIEGVFSGFVDALNCPFTAYFDRETTIRNREARMGHFYGIGAVLSWNEEIGGAEIQRVFEDSPAEAVGLLEGDIIVQVDDTVIVNQDLTEIVSWIRGEKGTYVEITIMRERERIIFNVMRDSIQVISVRHEMLENNIGYLRVSEFDRLTTEQFITAMKELESEGMDGLVIDLRNNPGGNLDTVVAMLKQMVPEGVIVSIEDRHGNVEERRSEGNNVFTKPLVVLVNEHSASASEIFAGAVQDYEIGTIVGTTTFGKALVQSIIELSDGSSLKLTVAEYFTPLGRSISESGIVPDIEIEFDFNQDGDREDWIDNQLEKAIEVLRDKISRLD